MPDQNQPTAPQPVQAPPVNNPQPTRPSFVAFEEQPPAPAAQPTTAPPPLPAAPPPPPPSAGSSNIVTPPSGGSKAKIIIVVIIVSVLALLGGFLFLRSQQPTAPDLTPIPTAAITAYCSSVKAYDKEGNLISSSALANLKPGDVVRFAASGISSEGTFDQARFTINNIQRPAVTTKVANTDEFYDEYTIPEGTTVFDVTAEVHHVETDTWY